MMKKNDGTLPNELAPLSESVKEPELERGLPQDLTGNKKGNVRKLAFAAAGVLALIFILLSLFLLRSNDEGHVEVNEPTASHIENSRPYDFAADQAKLLSGLVPPKENKPEPLPQPTAATFMPQPEPQPMTSASYGVVENTEPRRELMGDVSIDFGQSNTTAQASASNGRYMSTSVQSDFSEQLKPSDMPQGHARKRGDLTYLLGRGTNIGCTLNTKIVTTQSGITRCTVNKDIYSKNGKVLLVERGSSIIGEQTSALIHGQARVFILWNAIETPYGISVEINSPTADSLGASGQSAYVDRHFWERFGGAIMLSLVDDVASAAANNNRSNNNDVEFNYTRDSARDMAALALENSINIPPTGYVNQGTLLNVMVARDVDFSEIYKLVNTDWQTWEVAQ